MDGRLLLSHAVSRRPALSESVETQNLQKIADMASMSMAASPLPGSSSSLTRLPSTTGRRGLIVAKAARDDEGEKGSSKSSNSGRRELIFAVAAAATCSVANIAMGEEPKAGTSEARKKYAPVCVTIPTASICRK